MIELVGLVRRFGEPTNLELGAFPDVEWRSPRQRCRHSRNPTNGEEAEARLVVAGTPTLARAFAPARVLAVLSRELSQPPTEAVLKAWPQSRDPDVG